jgi:putative DNA primase/helicase
MKPDANEIRLQMGLDALRAKIDRASDPDDAPRKQENGHAEPNRKTANASLVIRRAADIEPEKIDWLWPGRIARGKHTCIAGEPGTGKSQLSIAIIAAITTGSEWPCGEGKARLGNVILLSAEDGAADTIRPRLDATGADLNRVHLISAVQDVDRRRTLNLQHDLDLLESKIAEIKDVALVVVDPISSYLGKTDSHKNSEVRSLLEPLSEMAERTRVAILSVTHFSKTGANTTTKALHRFIGSIAFTGAPRAAFAVVDDAEHDGRRLFLHAKNNLAPAPQGLAFRVEQCLVGDSFVASRIVWDGAPVAITANEALAADAAGSETRTAIEEAMDWLRELLADSPLLATQVRSEADAAGLSWATIKRAKKAAGVVAFRDGGTADKGRWLWRLPGTEPPKGLKKAYLTHDLNVSPLGEIEPLSGREAADAAPKSSSRPGGNGHDSAADDDSTIPAFLDRRYEVCAQCLAGWPDDPPTVAVKAKNGETVYVHERGCLRFWEKAHGNGACS